MAERHSMSKSGPDQHSICCGTVRIADVFCDAMGKHYTRIVDPTVNLDPSDLAYILERVLHLDNVRITVQ